ncbi:MAG: transketolase [Elusimicrobia bacterium]|nr:transketolase [Elusimicrobiota bacterium]
MPAAATEAPTLDSLRRLTRAFRVEILRMIEAAGSGHPGGSLSAIDFLTVLYFRDYLNVDPKNPSDPNRDRFILSKGHCVPALYCVLAHKGFLPVEELRTLRKFGSRLQGHPDRRRLPLIEANTGSLGQGLSIALGLALSAKLDRAPWQVFCMTGDGEIQEGQIWEAAMAAPKFKLGNLTWIVDYNQVQQEGLTKDQMDLAPLKDKLAAFNWHTQEIDGHDLDAIDRALAAARKVTDRPKAIILRTIKGKGVSFMELQTAWHGKAPNKEQADKAVAEIEGGRR